MIQLPSVDEDELRAQVVHDLNTLLLSKVSDGHPQDILDSNGTLEGSSSQLVEKRLDKYIEKEL